MGIHVLRNALLPFVTIIGLMMANFIGGAVVTEAVFTYPGIGRLLIQAIIARDYPLIQGCILVILLVYMLINLGKSTFSTPTSIRASNTVEPMDDMPLPPSSLFDLRGQFALVTGASRGLGWATAQALAAAGATVILNGRDAESLTRQCEKLKAWGFQADVAAFDVTNAAAVTRTVASIGSRHGRLDILVSNAGSTVRKPLLEQTEDDWRQVIDADLTAGWRIAREAARIMMPAGYGRIVMISSINGFVARPAITAYVAAKAGLHGLVRALALDLGSSGVTINAIAPGYFPTEGNASLRRADPDFESRIAQRTPAGRWGRPKELGAAAVYLASPASGFTTGSILTVDGGLSSAI